MINAIRQKTRANVQSDRAGRLEISGASEAVVAAVSEVKGVLGIDVFRRTTGDEEGYEDDWEVEEDVL
jgi:hypothetical protein